MTYYKMFYKKNKNRIFYKKKNNNKQPLKKNTTRLQHLKKKEQNLEVYPRTSTYVKDLLVKILSDSHFEHMIFFN